MSYLRPRELKLVAQSLRRMCHVPANGTLPLCLLLPGHWGISCISPWESGYPSSCSFLWIRWRNDKFDPVILTFALQSKKKISEKCYSFAWGRISLTQKRNIRLQSLRETCFQRDQEAPSLSLSLSPPPSHPSHPSCVLRENEKPSVNSIKYRAVPLNKMVEPVVPYVYKRYYTYLI